MIVNRLIIPEGNKLEFRIEHHENDKLYELKKGEFYYIKISDAVEPFPVREQFLSDGSHISVPTSLPDGEYVFEIGIMDKNAKYRIILPAVDERLRALNQLIVLRRLEE